MKARPYSVISLEPVPWRTTIWAAYTLAHVSAVVLVSDKPPHILWSGLWTWAGTCFGTESNVMDPLYP